MPINPLHSRAIKRAFVKKYGDKKLVSVVPSIDGDRIHVFVASLHWVCDLTAGDGKFTCDKASGSLAVKELRSGTFGA